MGFFLEWADLDDYTASKAIQKGNGKKGENYIRVTNIRGMKAKKPLSTDQWENYVTISRNHLCTHKRSPKAAEIQRIPHIYLLSSISKFSVADFDDGLIFIGTTYCLNNQEPRCNECPVKQYCRANLTDFELVEKCFT